MFGQRQRRRRRADVSSTAPVFISPQSNADTPNSFHRQSAADPAATSTYASSKRQRSSSARTGSTGSSSIRHSLSVKLRRLALSIRLLISQLTTRRPAHRSRGLSYVASVGTAIGVFFGSFYVAIATLGSPVGYKYLRRQRTALYWGYKPPPSFKRKIIPTARRRLIDEEPIPLLLRHVVPKSNGRMHVKRPTAGIDNDDRQRARGHRSNEPFASGDHHNNNNNNRNERESSSSVDSEYAFDDDRVRHKRCRRVEWERYYHPNCNSIHETSPSESTGTNTTYISHGYFRDVISLTDQMGEDIVMKILRMKKHDVDYELMESIRVDALVMERLTASPRITEIYGHCGVSVYTESLPGEIEQNAVPGDTRGHMKQREVDKHFGPQNDWSPELKLSLALLFAEAIADLHGYFGGVIVHGDIQLVQFLIDSQGNMKLNDYNRAVVMLYDEERGEYCKYVNGGAYGNLRSPEEWWKRPLNEQIDVFSFGNAVYELLTGLEPFYDVNDDEVVHRKMKRGETAYIDDRYRTRSFAESKLVQLIEKCFVFDPEERITIFEAVRFLQEAINENDKRKLRGLA